MVPNLSSFSRLAREHFGFTDDLHVGFRVIGANPEDRPRAPLAVNAMTGGHSDRLGSNFDF